MPHLAPFSWLILSLMFWLFLFIYSINYSSTSAPAFSSPIKKNSTPTYVKWNWS